LPGDAQADVGSVLVVSHQNFHLQTVRLGVEVLNGLPGARDGGGSAIIAREPRQVGEHADAKRLWCLRARSGGPEHTCGNGSSYKASA
jgi:hypothetical protein